MIYGLDLQTAGMAAGVLLVVITLPGFFKPALVQDWLKRFPRSSIAGIVLLSLHHEQYLPRLPLWLTATVISRDVLLLIGLAVIYYTCGKVVAKPHLIGKAATVLQMVAVCWALLKLPSGWLNWFALGATVCTGGSGAIYVLDGVRQLSASPASLPATKQ